MTPLKIFLHPIRAAEALAHAEEMLASERTGRKEARIAAALAMRSAGNDAKRLDKALADISSLSARLEESAARIALLEAQCAEINEMRKCLDLAERNIKKVKRMREKYEERIRTLERRLEAANASLRQNNRRTFADEDDMDLSDDMPSSTARNSQFSPMKRTTVQKDSNAADTDSSQGDWLESLPAF